jgi:hypothetical protein
MGRYLLLWLLGIPLPILLLIWVFGGLTNAHAYNREMWEPVFGKDHARSKIIPKRLRQQTHDRRFRHVAEDRQTDRHSLFAGRRFGAIGAE